MFISLYPSSPYVVDAQTKILDACRTVDDVQTFMKDYPTYPKMDKAQEKLTSLQK